MTAAENQKLSVSNTGGSCTQHNQITSVNPLTPIVLI